jgi:transposase InsO family protein
MPWQEVSIMSLRKEFVLLASREGANLRALCRQFGISAKTGYKLLKRYQGEGEAGLEDRSRRPTSSPRRTPPEIEAAVVAVRDLHPAWGGRKLRARLDALGRTDLPSPSTITAILRRHDRLDVAKSVPPAAWQRFEHAAANDLWQMDFKGHFALREGRCHPLTVLDDHSRYAVCLRACANEQAGTVQAALTDTFRRYGLPWRMTMDNGSPWGDDGLNPYTTLTVWLLRLGIAVSHSRPYHPQTQGKDERFHRTLNAEVLAYAHFADQAAAQQRFDSWRSVYNLERPHQALGMQPPISRFRPSPRPFPETLPAIEYGPDDRVRKVQAKGELHYRGRAFNIGHAFHGYPVALRPSDQDGVLDVFFCQHRIACLNLHDPQ